MATTKKSQTAPATMKPDEGKKLNVVVTPGKSQAYMTASLLFDGVVGNAITAQTFAKGDFGTLDLTECVNVLREKAERTHSGDLRHAETTLTAQAAALDAIFNDMARRAALNAGQYLDAAERYLRLALKAQGQCRATLETLAAIKNPPVVFAKQANISHGPQQVNNGVAPTPAGKLESGQSKLLQDQNDGSTQMDTRATAAPVRSNQAVETVATVHRPQKPRG